MKSPALRESGDVQMLVAEDDPRLADLLDQSPREAGWDVEVVGDGTVGLRPRPDRRAALRRAAARLDAAGDGRRHRLPPAARPRRHHPGADAHRPRRGARPHRRPRRRRRRLPRQALRPRRAARAAAGPAPPERVRRAVAGRDGRRPGRRPGARRVRRGGTRGRASTAREFDVLHAAGLPGRHRRLALHHPRRGLGRRDRPAQQRHRRLPRRASGPRSTGRSAPAPSPPCAGPATGVEAPG